MTRSRQGGPVLFCYDGSEGSRGAMRAAGELIEPSVEAVVLTVWEPIAVRLAHGGAFASGFIPKESDIDEQEESFARAASKDGAERAVEHGYKASAVTKESTEGIARAILAVADEISARLIVCGQRGRGPLGAALLGSVSHALAAHARRPVLIAPEEVASHGA
ncbi:MAG TPA: universal stress protein [Acidimicrobiales bacterium]|nr:universal stress protein [Acidimicrobiales bacterium]